MKLKYIALILTTVVLAACTSSRPSYVLSSGTMEDVLYDMHKAHFLNDNKTGGRADGAKQYALMLSVLKKHDVSQAEWDSSMVYYTRHADDLEEIYADLMDRLSYEAEAMGASVAAGDVMADSTNIWHQDSQLLIYNSPLLASTTWTIDADTLLVAGEKLTLSFDGMVLNPEESCQVAVVLAIKLKNDSIVCRQQTATQTGIYRLELGDDEQIGIKQIKGMFMMYPGMSYGSGEDTKDNVQVFAVSNIKLLHEAPKAPKVNVESEAVDTVSATSTVPAPQEIPITPTSDAKVLPQKQRLHLDEKNIITPNP